MKLIIDNIETDYDIYENGDIYSHKTNTVLKGSLFNTGYRMVRLTINGKKKAYAVHRLVAETYILNPNNLPIVNHIDGNKLNNDVSNLEWVSQSQNRKHAIKTGITNLAIEKRKKIDIKDETAWIRYKNTSYLISINGEVYNTKTKILLKQTPNNSGYIRYTLRINGKNVSKLGHVLVMETWGGIEKIGTSQVINHIDGDKTNNNLNNLEIISKKENALHSHYILNNNVKPVIRINEEKEIEYPSISEAARQLHITDGAIRYALKNNSKCCQSYWRYK